MIRKEQRAVIKHYKKMVKRITLAFLTTIVFFTALILMLHFLLGKLGIDIHSTFNPAIISIILYIICVWLASAASYFTVWNVFKPLQEISAASKKIAVGEYDVKLEYTGKVQELADTIENFNYMAQELNSIEMIRNDFVANVSHEFKTPLTSLTGYLTLLQDDTLTAEERKEYISKSFFSIEKLNDLTENILRLSRIEHQADLGEPDTYRLDEQLREAIVLLEPKWSRKDITFDLSLKEVTYTGQRSLLFQVWTNLLSNAIKFSHDSGVVTVSLEESPHHYKVIFCDEGIGMTEEEQRHIFDKFYQADHSRRSQGNGLGLALCKEITDRCGGKIYVSSKPGGGSVFLVSLRK